MQGWTLIPGVLEIEPTAEGQRAVARGEATIQDPRLTLIDEGKRIALIQRLIADDAIDMSGAVFIGAASDTA